MKFQIISIENVEDEMKINDPPPKKIFGSDFVEIRPQGSAELSFGLNSSRTDNPVLPERNRSLTTFDFDQNTNEFNRKNWRFNGSRI